MSTENAQSFMQRLLTDEAFAGHLSGMLHDTEPGERDDRIVTFAAEAGLPFTREEWQSLQQTLISDADLCGIAGGMAHLVAQSATLAAIQSGEQNQANANQIKLQGHFQKLYNALEMQNSMSKRMDQVKSDIISKL